MKVAVDFIVIFFIMNWLEKDIAKQYIVIGFPEKMANKMGIEVVKKMTEASKVMHRDLYPFIFIGEEVIIISTNLEI